MDKDPLRQLEEKLGEGMLPYEALQYVQSFVARKKRHISSDITSQLVFLGARKLIETDSAADAGTLLLWFIEGGAGEEHPFLVEPRELDSDNSLYCDIDRLYRLIKKLESAKSVLLCEKIYLPLSKITSRIKPPRHSSLQERLTLLEDLFADVFEENSRWLLACKSVGRLEDMERLAKLLDRWSAEGYSTEKPLFFARYRKMTYDTFAVTSYIIGPRCSSSQKSRRSWG